MKKILPAKKLALRALTLRNLSLASGGADNFPRDTAQPSVCPVSCLTREPGGCATGDNCVILPPRTRLP